MAFELAELARPLTRNEALAAGLLIDTTRAASFLGFTAPASMTSAAWDELIGTPGLHATAAEKAAAVERLRAVWVAAQRAVIVYRTIGSMARSVRFECPSVAAKKKGALVRALLVCYPDERRTVLTICLEGET